MNENQFLTTCLNAVDNLGQDGDFHLTELSPLETRGYGFSGKAVAPNKGLSFRVSIDRNDFKTDANEELQFEIYQDLKCSIALGSLQQKNLPCVKFGQFLLSEDESLSFDEAGSITFPARNKGRRVEGFDAGKFLEQTKNVLTRSVAEFPGRALVLNPREQPDADPYKNIATLMRDCIFASWAESGTTNLPAVVPPDGQFLFGEEKVTTKTSALESLSIDELNERLDKKKLHFSPSVLESCIVALKSGQNIILSGPPGCGKSELARVLTELLSRNPNEVVACTATPAWTSDDLIGHYLPDFEGKGLDFHEGFFLQALERYNDVILIDEINRCDLDACFGELFTLLADDSYAGLQRLPFTKKREGGSASVVVAGEKRDLKYLPDEQESEVYVVPKDFRIIGTMNSFDRSHLHKFSAALSRRFSIVHVSKDPDLAGDLAAQFAEGIGGDDYEQALKLSIESLLANSNEFLSPSLGKSIVEVCRTRRDLDLGSNTQLQARKDILNSFVLVAGNQLDISIDSSSSSEQSKSILDILTTVKDAVSARNNWTDWIETLSNLPNLSEHRDAIREEFLN